MENTTKKIDLGRKIQHHALAKTIWLKELSDDDLEYFDHRELIELSKELRDRLILANEEIKILKS